MANAIANRPTARNEEWIKNGKAKPQTLSTSSMPTNSARNIASQLGVDVDWNPKTGLSSFSKDGQTIYVKPGEGDKYGFGAVSNGYQTIADVNKFKNAFAPAQNIQQAISAPPTYDPTADITAAYDQEKAAQAANIHNALNSQVSDLNYQIAQAPQQYQPAKNEASFSGAKEANAIKEAMAYGGQGNSGTNLTAQSANNAATTGAIANLNVSQRNLVNSLKKAISDAQASSSAQELESNANINAAKIQAIINAKSQAATMANDNYWKNKEFGLNEKSTNASVANTEANTVYQNLINAGYPAKQAAEMAQTAAQTKSIQLANEAQEIANRYAPQIAQGQLDEQTLKNKYQELVNAGYPKQQAADLAATYAQTANIKANTAQTQAETNNLNSGLTAQGKATTTSTSTAKPTKTEQLNADFADDYATLKRMSVADAKAAMDSNWASMIAKYGPDGAKKLWNTVMADAIAAKQAGKR